MGRRALLQRRRPPPRNSTRGWLRTGDIASVDEHGFVQITDRAKDVIKSGGEWISSVELENELMAHPDVLEAAVIAMPDERWAERPLCCVVLREGADAERRGAASSTCARGSRMVAAGRVRVHRRGPEDERRQVRQEGAARAPAGGDARAPRHGIATAIVWFRRDLRTHDYAAPERHEQIIPVFCLDDRPLHGRQDT